ncbi:ABC transporter substrate-binding protein [Rhodococcus sp. X156]|uniref:ABC transporter substrate-binding protein n=1 Tax=Rhodococcus sp. X156 TaxID=2499145 RepID=UPI000FDC1296|nr:ABC transporter substrate-binding protein [Rhodococcus sp. X156]
MARLALVRLAGVAMAGSLLLAGCAGGGSDDDTAASPSGDQEIQLGLVGDQPDGGDPVAGGTLTFGTQAAAATMDPAKTAARGSSGGSELAAVYDVLVRYSSADKKFVPQLAKSFEASADGLTWTLKLRENVKFSDGTPLDSAAVLWSWDRYTQNRGNGSELWKMNLDSAVAADPSTVVVKLKKAWPELEAMMALGQGMIVAPTSMKSGTFQPIGAGPFVQERYAPNEERVLAARADYWGGKPYLDKLRFVALNGPQATWESLKSNQLQVGYLRASATAISDARAAGLPGYLSFLNAGSAEMINNREGRPGADVRVRQAIAYATSPTAVDDRVDEGKGRPSSGLFDPSSQWAGDVKPVAHDPEKAKQLLAEAKKDGYNGELKYVVLQEPRDRAIGLAVQAQLQAVGFTVTIMPANSAEDVVNNVYIKRDFDLAHAGLGLYEDIPFLGLYTTLQSASPSNVVGYKDAQMDTLLGELQAAGTVDAKKAVIGKIQQRANESVPSVSLGAIPSYIAWQKNVHGVTPHATDIMLFDKAWMKP